MRRHILVSPAGLAALACLASACLPQALTAAAARVTLPTIAVRVLAGTDPAVLHDLLHVRAPRNAEPVTLQIDLAHQRVLNGAGRIVAGADSVRPPYLQSVVDKWRYAASLAALAKAHPLELRSDWGEQDRTVGAAPLPWVGGTEATFVVPHVMPERPLLMFGIGPRGDIYFLGQYGLTRDPAEPVDRLPSNGLSATATAIRPFGAEHIVAVTAADPRGMYQLFAWLVENSASHGVVDTQGEVLLTIEALKDVRIGLLASYTCSSAPECAR
jgi:hypothetical protein